MTMNLTSRDVLASILGLFDTFLLDCDGVLYNGDAAIDGAVEVTDMLRSKGMNNRHRIKPSILRPRFSGKKLIFVTNTSAKSRQDCKRKLDRLGFHTEMVCNPLMHRVTSHYIQGRDILWKLRGGRLHLQRPQITSDRQGVFNWDVRSRN
jgi:hypothetical protein